MNVFEVNIYAKSEDLPTTLLAGNFFHSQELFRIAELSPGDSPYMVVATEKGSPAVMGQLLVIVQRRGNLLPPYLYTHAHAHGEGEYAEGVDVDGLFSLMLDAVTAKLQRHLCLYIEFSGLGKKMFAYRHFRQQGYFPVAWQEVRNSLHSMTPEQRISDKLLQRIGKLYNKGVDTHIVRSDGEIRKFHTLLRRFYFLKPRRYIPSLQYFRELAKSKDAMVCVTTYKGKMVIGGCACVFSKGNAYLWYLGAKRKTCAPLHPNLMTVWFALKYAHAHGAQHMCFMDAGLPWHKNLFREFILGFGGKPVAKYRWFKFHSRPINWLLKWIYKD